MNMFKLVVLIALSIFTTSAASDVAKIAVATNFIAPMRAIQKEFQAKSGHRLIVSFASSGKLYAQIKHGAPFDLFLSADQDKPTRLARESIGLKHTQFTYATGRLVLWSSDAALLNVNMDIAAVANVLRQLDNEKIAVANPQLAPYGRAATEVLERLASRAFSVVKGENIAQAFQFVQTGNAPLGFVAYSQIIQQSEHLEGSTWLVPHTLHQAIKQDAILLQSGAQNVAAQAFLNYLSMPETQNRIAAMGYGLVAF